MNVTRCLRLDFLPVALIAAMAITRYHHFGDALHLPDASLAVFFFAGFCRQKLFLPFLLLLAGVIDFLAIANGTSAWCLSPAYVFLVPAYTAMWWTGRTCLQLAPGKWQMLMMLVLLAASTLLAFAISNLSFYWFSGRFETLTLWAYVQATLSYLWLYLSSTLIYGAVGFATLYTVNIIATRNQQRQEA